MPSPLAASSPHPARPLVSYQSFNLNQAFISVGSRLHFAGRLKGFVFHDGIRSA
jgi:hypothetical protein